MEVLRRNTDYALRAAINLAANYGEKPVSTRDIAEQENISYQLACKLMQKLVKAHIAESVMGVKGGYKLADEPSKISIAQIIDVIQGPVHLNKCMDKEFNCEKSGICPIKKKLSLWQNVLNQEFADTTLEDLIK